MGVVKSINKLTFPRGTHPPDVKNLTRDKPIEPGPVPKELVVPLSQHIGSVCETIVKKGQEVTAGQKIGSSESFISAAVHSPVNGKVKKIDLMPHSQLGRSEAVVIESTATEPARPLQHAQNDIDVGKYSAEQICQAVAEAGIVGMGGAGFPTMVKITPAQPTETMIINGCECEPYLTCDYRIMLEWTRQIVNGIKLAGKAAGNPKVYIGIEDNKPEAIEAFRRVLAESAGMENARVVELKTKYPQGGERQLIKSIIGRDVPTGSIPPKIGLLVINVATAAAIAEAVISSQPLTHRVVTVTGEAISNPGNYYTAVGTKVGELLEHCGGVTEKSAKVLLGGPMMGVALADMDTPIMKTSGGVTVLTREQIGESKYRGRQTACIRCGRCLEVCPERLNPTRLAHAVKAGKLELAEKYHITACIECGCCSYICPAHIELAGHIKTGKLQLARQAKRIGK